MLYVGAINCISTPHDHNWDLKLILTKPAAERISIRFQCRSVVDKPRCGAGVLVGSDLVFALRYVFWAWLRFFHFQGKCLSVEWMNTFLENLKQFVLTNILFKIFFNSSNGCLFKILQVNKLQEYIPSCISFKLKKA